MPCWFKSTASRYLNKGEKIGMDCIFSTKLRKQNSTFAVWKFHKMPQRQYGTYFMTFYCSEVRDVDPHWFNADPDPAFFLIADPDPVPNPGFWSPNIEKKNKAVKLFLCFFGSKQFTYPLAAIKDVQATCEAFIPQKRTSSTSKLAFLHFCGSFCPSWIRIRIPNADPDPADQNESGSVRIRIRNTQQNIMKSFREPYRLRGRPRSRHRRNHRRRDLHRHSHRRRDRHIRRRRPRDRLLLL